MALFLEPQYIIRFRQALYGAFSSILLFLSLLIQNVIWWLNIVNPRAFILPLTLGSIQLLLAVLLVLTYGSIPRRPDVYKDGKIVDRQYTTSIIGRFGFQWPTQLLRFAAQNKGLEIEDLPEIDHQTRSKGLRHKFDEMSQGQALWKAIMKSHRWAFCAQICLSTSTCVTNFLPQVALYFILRALEDRDRGTESTLTLWIWVIGLGASVIINAWLEAWLFMVCYSRVGLPTFQQLAAIIFSKAMRQKDIKGTSKQAAEEPRSNGNVDTTATNEMDASHVKVNGIDDGDNDDDQDEDQKARQSIINLVGIDSFRISSFATYVYIFPSTFLKFALALGFLVRLIGWIPLLAGLVIPALATPVNVLASKLYMAAEDELMKTRDRKMAVVTEALQGIRQIKFSALEADWQSKIMKIRHRELKTQLRVFKMDTIIIAIYILGPVMLAAVSLGVYAIMHGSLDASTAFTTVSVFEAIEMTMSVLPEMISEFIDAKISHDRIEKFMKSPEQGQYAETGRTISFTDASIAWPSDEKTGDEGQYRQNHLNLEFPKNELSVICGKTGSGKSLLLASIIGEADILNGTIELPPRAIADERYDERAQGANWYLDGSIAYVAQIPWIENATIKDNILFGLPLDRARYEKTLFACALPRDLEMLPDGELTDVGANGINLSGGQKWRVSLARALYSRATILVLDDVFSAVDTHVGRHLYEEALTGELGRNRTRILVTHHVALCLPKTKYLVLLGDGKALSIGTVDQLRSRGELKAIIAQDEEEKQEVRTDEDQPAIDNAGAEELEHQTSHTPGPTRRRSSAALPEGEPVKAPKKFIEKENREQGAIKIKIYAEYLKASGGLPQWGLTLFAFGICLVIILGRSFWISIWTRSYENEESAGYGTSSPRMFVIYLQRQVSTLQVHHNLWYYLSIYVAWAVAQCVVGTIRYLIIFYGSIRASKVLFENLTYHVLRAPLRWLDTMPVGRILNRFTADFNMIDSRVAMDVGFMMHNVMIIGSVIIAGLLVSPWIIAFALVLLIVCGHYALRYLTAAREVKRLESNSKSPIFESFGTALTGLGTIRAFDNSEVYVEKMYRKIDQYGQAYWHLWLFNRWMGFRLEMVGALFATITAAIIVANRRVDASLAGFALSFALEYTTSLVWALRDYANVELDMNAVERISEYSSITVEDEGGDAPPAAWPTEGRLEVYDLVVGYAEDLPPVLKGLSFNVNSKQRVGVVGRTGAGKSSLTLALFRFLEAREGVIFIDGLDISKIRIHDLRSRLAIIPQDPVLFSGTVRSNLDPFNQHQDNELRDALERVHLISRSEPASVGPSGTTTPLNAEENQNIFRKLSSKISEGGLNLSQGQRQLLCLARSIVSRPKIMVLDEATSAVDIETDALIQRSIREEFEDSTLIVIAHRLTTIADFDKILVLGDGKVIEYDEPRRLMEKVGGAFYEMVEASGQRELLETIIEEAAGSRSRSQS